LAAILAAILAALLAVIFAALLAAILTTILVATVSHYINRCAGRPPKYKGGSKSSQTGPVD
jgi:hypothetical protein